MRARVLGLLGRHAEALQLAEDVHAHFMSRHGPNHQKTLHAANNLAVSLANCGFDARRRTLLRDAYDRATHALGVEHDTTHFLRTGLASSLHRVGEAPREDMVEAAALLEISVRVARETKGAEHPRTAFVVQLRDKISSAIDAFDSGNSQRPTKRRRLRLRDVDRRAEVVNAAPDFLNEERTSRARRRNTVAWAHCYRKGLTKLGTMSESESDSEEDEEDEEEESPPPPPPRRPPLVDEAGYVPPPPPPPEQSRCVVS